ncbi:unnamed protein product [Allacma fusca]|uniref:BTB domain-containing protein n=1 Tax=Allacma fusca TaxID=39272 RepID=A0A8J2KBU2_9HEXA|nr:unnamed protein product [Allacma fusca]
MGEKNTLNLTVLKTTCQEDDYHISLSCPKKRDLLGILEEPSCILKQELTFQEGILSTVPHSIFLHLFRDGSNPNVGLFVRVNPKSSEIVRVTAVRANFIGNDDTTDEASLYPSSHPVGHDMEDYEYFEYNYRWPDNTMMIYFTIRITRREYPELQQDDPYNTTLAPSQLEDGYLDTKSLFLSEDYSDVTIECSGETFPVHRLVLAGKSDYFAAMFRLPLKETAESRVEINDIEPPVLKEFLRFIYTGSVDQDILADVAASLYTAADKYNVEKLVSVCENQLLHQVSLDNAMTMYDLSQNRPHSKLAKRAKEVISWNKSSFAEDAESFKNFTCKYPELMFEIFKL